MPTAVTSHSLIARVRAAEDRAWTSFVAIYYPMVYRWCRHSGISPHDASDIAQNVFRALIDSLDSYEPTGTSGSFRRWLRGVTRHKLQDHWRSNATQIVAAGDVDAGEAPPVPELADEDAAESDLALAVRRALDVIRNDVEPQTWQAAWRVLVDDQRPADAAQELGMSANAVYKARARVVRRVRDQLSDLLDATGENS